MDQKKRLLRVSIPYRQCLSWDSETGIKLDSGRFQFLTGNVLAQVASLQKSEVKYVSIPYRQCLSLLMGSNQAQAYRHVSIPYRQCLSAEAHQLGRDNVLEFQFLIGDVLASKTSALPAVGLGLFQFLIGNVLAVMVDHHWHDEGVSIPYRQCLSDAEGEGPVLTRPEFQFLIGNVLANVCLAVLAIIALASFNSL